MGIVEVTVVGAGPAGCGTAIHLARAGCRVTVIDKAMFPRDKCCGDGLTTGALRHLERLGFDPATVPSWRVVRETTWRSPSGHTIQLDVPDDGGARIAVARRTELDAALVALARDHGVTVLEGHGVRDVRRSSGRMLTEAEGFDEPLLSDYVVAADGMWSPVRRIVAADKDRYLGEIHAFRQYFRNVDGPASDHLWVSFERDIIPGYVWSFPVGDGSANVGFGISRKPGQSVHWMKDAWPDILARPHVRAALGDSAEPEGPHKAWPIPARIRTNLLSAVGGRVLFVGDAARVVDPLTGEGIGQALDSGEMAAGAIVRAGTDQPLTAARRYSAAMRSGMVIDNGVARAMARLVSHEPAARAVIRLAPKGPWRGRYAIKWAFEDNPRAALLTPWRWPARFADKGGAFR